jgi:manganese transport protein
MTSTVVAEPGSSGATVAGATVAVATPAPATWHRTVLCAAGAAFVASMAYVDPGNFATNFAAGSATGYQLLWVVVAANVVAMFVQSLSAKLGLATGRDLAELCGQRYGTATRLLLWAQAEVVAMATDVAEVVGGAIALRILFGVPPVAGGALMGVLTFVLVGLRGRGAGRFESTVVGLLVVVALGVGYDALRSGVDIRSVGAGLAPGLSGSHGPVLVLAVGIIGATVMPHVIYLHSALTSEGPRPADPRRRRGQLRVQWISVVAALGGAGLINAAMLVTAAARSGSGAQDTLTAVHDSLGRALGPLAATAFAVALLSAGLASCGVGTLAGQVVLRGFLHRHIPLLLRRAVTLAPALLVLAVTTDLTHVLVLSQVVLSFGLPFALVPLILLTRDRRLMGDLVNRWYTTVAAVVLGVAVVGVNVALVASSL